MSGCHLHVEGWLKSDYLVSSVQHGLHYGKDSLRGTYRDSHLGKRVDLPVQQVAIMFRQGLDQRYVPCTARVLVSIGVNSLRADKDPVKQNMEIMS